MHKATLVYSNTKQPVEKGDIFYVKNKSYTYAGDWDIVDVIAGAELLIVDTDKGYIEGYSIGVELQNN